LQVSGDNRDARGKKNLDVIREQHLHAQPAGVEREIFHVEAILLKKLFFVGRPKHGVNRRGKTAACRAHAVDGGSGRLKDVR